MPAKTRSSSGRFESAVAPSGKEENYEETQMSIPIRKSHYHDYRQDNHDFLGCFPLAVYGFEEEYDR